MMMLRYFRSWAVRGMPVSRRKMRKLSVRGWGGGGTRRERPVVAIVLSISRRLRVKGHFFSS